LISLLTGNLNTFGQTRVSGFVKDKNSGETLIGAYIFEENTNNATCTDNNGYFSIQVKQSNSLLITYVGYEKYTFHNPDKDTIVHILLNTSNKIEEVVVKSNRTLDNNIEQLSTQEINNIPSLGGKPDVLKTLQLIPGIQSQNEGSSLLLVRGGDPGQNLYLIDNVPIIYVNHLGGFTSVFNPDMINNIEIYKGGFPSEFGGKLSSIVNITQKEGNISKLKGNLSIGITDASFSVEGPLKFKNTSFILTGRKTLVDPLMILASSLSDGGDYIVSYGFHDINGKFTWKPDAKNSFYINIYEGDDYLNFWSNTKDDITNEKSRLLDIWGNWLISSRWNRVVSTKLYNTNILSYTRYRLKNKQTYSISGNNEKTDFKREYLSSVSDLAFQSKWNLKINNNWNLKYGLQSSYLLHIPNYSYQTNTSSQGVNERINSLESALYFENKVNIYNKIDARFGARLVNYFTKDFSNTAFEPRLSFNIKLHNKHSVNLTYMNVNQYAHLVFTAGDIMSNEVWIPAGKQIAPAKSNQYSIGWNSYFYDEMYEAKVSLYYKNMNNLSTYKEGYTSIMGDANWRSKVETDGSGIAKGVELFIKKNYGDYTGFLSYSFTNATRKFPNINQGVEYLFEYDRPHSGSISVSRIINNNLTFNAAWIYQTGLPYTPAIGRQYTPSTNFNEDGETYYFEAIIYGKRNSARMKDYHRLDIGVNYTTITKRGNKAIWSFSVYNIYNRHNPYYYYYNTDNSGELYNPATWNEYKSLALYQVSFFPLMPTFSYKVFFDGSSNKKRQKTPFKQKIINWLYYKN